MKRFDSTAQFVSRTDNDAPFAHAKKETPDRTINAALPFGLALGAGLVTFIAVGLIVWGVRGKVQIAMIAAGAVMLLVMFWWIWLLWKEKLIWSIEQVFGTDINRDGYTGPPQYTNFELQRGPGSIRFGTVGVPPQLVIDWCEAARNRESLAYSAWESRFALPDGTQGRERYQEFRRQLVKEGFAEEAGGNIGLRIKWRNPDAVAFVNGFANATPEDGTPLLEG